MLTADQQTDLAAYAERRVTGLIDNPALKFAIAFSGGGDSTALVHALRDHPQKGPVFIVDHQLRAGSDREADKALAFAKSRGYEARILRWDNRRPKTGIQQKARHARYALLGQACREASIQFLLTAHTLDDQAETLLMRYHHGTGWRGAAGMSEARYGALWPELAQVSLLRPLLDISRIGLRQYNKEHALSWIEDPSNSDDKFERIRARHLLAQKPKLRNLLLNTRDELLPGLTVETDRLKAEVTKSLSVDPFGIITNRALPSPQLLRVLLQAASGRGDYITRDKREDLRNRMKAGDFSASTLGGSMVEKRGYSYQLFRDPSLAKGRQNKPALARQKIRNGAVLDMIWDGRFRIYGTSQAGLTLGPLYKSIGKLSEVDRMLVKSVPSAARSTLPTLFENGQPIFIGAGECRGLTIKSLIAERIDRQIQGECAAKSPKG